MKRVLQQTVRVVCGVLVALPMAPVFVSAPASAASNTGPSAYGSCQNINVPVALGTGQPKDQTIAGTFCRPFAKNTKNSVELVVHGGTYNRNYWDFPVDEPNYSYTARALQAGHATLAIDRLGAGASSHPLSTSVTLPSDAYTVHQLIGWLRSAQSFSDVSLVGHSVGSTVSIQESSTYNDANRLVVTGLVHALSFGGIMGASTSFYPANLDSQFKGSSLDVGYLTSLPGKRGPLFYSSSADPAVITYDEAHKDVMATTELTGAVGSIEVPALLNASNRITIPVLSVVGQQDMPLCLGPLGVNCSSDATVTTQEAPYYAHAASFTARAVPNTGHDLTLHPSASQSFSDIEQWIQAH